MTRCMRPVRPSKKASFPAAALRCCVPPSTSKGFALRTTTRRPASRSCVRHCPYPARQIAINAGEDGSVIVGKILEKDQYSYGFDSQTGEYGNLVTKGIIDPTKVVRVAIQNAASVAALLITTEAMVAEVPKIEPGRRRHASRRRAWVAWVVWTSKSNRSEHNNKIGPAAMPGLFCISYTSIEDSCLEVAALKGSRACSLIKASRRRGWSNL